MNAELKPRLIAITGGSGAGKSWLAEKLEREFGDDSARLSLDDFYRDLSQLPVPQREKVNFDDPGAIDWALFESVLRECRAGNEISLPRYDFNTHTRLLQGKSWKPGRLVFVDGLWLLRRPAVRALFDLRIFLNCPETLRWERRLARDVAERGRTPESVREQFWGTVAPMHDRFVAPQIIWADVIVREPLHAEQFSRLIETIRALMPQPDLSLSRTAPDLRLNHQHISRQTVSPNQI